MAPPTYRGLVGADDQARERGPARPRASAGRLPWRAASSRKSALARRIFVVGRWRVVRTPWIRWGCGSDGRQGLAAAGSGVPHGAACCAAVGVPGDILDKARRPMDPEALRAWSRRRQVPRQGGAAPPRRPLLDAALFIIVFLIY